VRTLRFFSRRIHRPSDSLQSPEGPAAVQAQLQYRARQRRSGNIRDENGHIVKLMRWGLVPSWSREPAIGNQMINARCETLDQRASFKQLLARNRCLIPADGFFEWRRIGRAGKIPMAR
jgi:putative SOS response-associated peptidase YedK